MRLSGTESELHAWLSYLKLLQDKKHVNILEEGKLYKNRGESEIYRIYLEVDLLL
ncbi:hypothetical protein CAL7102_06165 [Dulcicalothrix desertica PCC 7102]|nr:hypothetical protein CAL7102_06165 [Dulcicalothrix desertica PCC 7102]